MKFAGTVSTFEAEIPAVDAGTYTLRIVAANPKTVNFSMHESELTVR